MSVVEVSNVSFGYNSEKVVSDVSLSVDNGVARLTLPWEQSQIKSW